ncbi:MAG TPA: hypothetical protein PLZ57_10290 [Pseudobdellovibrionaceae bacterium]|nr:hypothetical protein [Pseudobdellovibrionaceae bacterium]
MADLDVPRDRVDQVVVVVLVVPPDRVGLADFVRVDPVALVVEVRVQLALGHLVAAVAQAVPVAAQAADPELLVLIADPGVDLSKKTVLAPTVKFEFPKCA